jgi:hypothetical protein
LAGAPGRLDATTPGCGNYADGHCKSFPLPSGSGRGDVGQIGRIANRPPGPNYPAAECSLRKNSKFRVRPCPKVLFLNLFPLREHYNLFVLVHRT